ncbi:MAG: hypothetical protein WBB45_00930 [Cyclobacteriaceae bacterium]
MVNIALIRFRRKHKGEKDHTEHVFKIPLNINHVLIPTIIPLATLLVLPGYNIPNIITGAG